MERRLAAILAADVVGYTRLMGKDEAGTLRRVTELRQSVLEPLIAEHHGRIVKLMGDGLLVEFASVVNALTCAVAWQNDVAEREAAADEDKRFKFRIGINLGDVIVEGDDIHGDGVNIAARLEGEAEPGGICLSGDAYRQAKGKVEVDFEDLGEHDLKNVAEPVRIYRIAGVGFGTAAASPAKAPLALPDKPSIAVLPFTNMSGDPEQDYFADGITEDIITELSRFQSIFVIARSSVFTYKGQTVRIQDIGRDLGVHYVVEGSVRKAGERVRVTVQLIDVQSGNHIWAERYDRNLVDIFELQDELTQGIAATLPGRVESADIERVKRTPFHDIGAYDCVLRAKLDHHRGTPENNAEALRLLDQALSADPECASAYAWKGCLLTQGYSRGYIEYSDELEEEIYQGILKGLSLDENDLECVRILCEYRIVQNRSNDALVLNDRALRINPNDPRIVAQRGEILTWLGQPQEGVEFARKAMRLDPFEMDSWSHYLGRALFGARQYREAISAFKRVPLPRYSHHAFIAACHAYLGEDEDAEVERTEILRLKRDFSSGEFSKALFYGDDADQQHVRQGLVKAGLPD